MSNESDDVRVCAVLSSYNRKIATLSALRFLYISGKKASIALSVVLVDDGSTDGTPDAVSHEFPQVKLIHGSGDLFWNQAMRKGIEVAIQSMPDFILLLNDDTYLDVSAISRLMSIATMDNHRESILVGSVNDPDTGEITYGGRYSSSRSHPLRFDCLVQPDKELPVPCDSFNANCVLIPRSVVNKVGNLSASFRHSKGDYDYGVRARSAGIQIYVAPGTYGTCRRDNILDKPSWDKSIWRDLHDYATNPKRMPFDERIKYFREHGNIFWWIYVPLPYIRFLLRRIISKWI